MVGAIGRKTGGGWALTYTNRRFLLQIQGYRLLPKTLIALIMCIFEEDPLSGYIQKVEKRTFDGNKIYTREDIFEL